MTWLYSPSFIEFFFIGCFLLLYSLYFFRTFYLARQLNTTAWAVIPKFFLRTGYFSLLLIALLGPSFGEGEQTIETQLHDVFLLVDISRSMDASDIAPSRLEHVKYAIQQLSDSLTSDRFGLVAVADEAFILAPLTTDHDAIKRVTQDLQSSRGQNAGTNLCASLELALQKLFSDPTTRKSTKAIVLFSDGENFGFCNSFVFNKLRTNGISLFTIGIGTTAGSTIRKGSDFVRDEQQQIVRSRLNRIFLQGIARSAQGKYFEADAESKYINDLISSLRSLRSRSVDQQRVAIAGNKYYYFLRTALLLIVFDLLITVRTFRL